MMAGRADGILLVDKQFGETSYDVVRKTKRALSIKKVGHAGTLDPFATGLLIILIGQGTKLSSFIMKKQKVYLVRIRLGMETDTLDPTGRAIKFEDVPHLELPDVERVARDFVGELEQVPPAYSAIKIKGRKAYEIAREGKTVPLKSRKVMIYNMVVLDMNLPFIDLKVACSSGTYIRSLASDFGKRLGTCAYAASLRRIQSGIFSVDHSVSSKEISPGSGIKLEKNIIPLPDALPDMQQVAVSEQLAARIRSGYQPRLSEVSMENWHEREEMQFLKIVCNTGLVAIADIQGGQWDSYRTKLSIRRVFH